MTNLLLIPTFIGGLRGWELIVIALLILLLFGANRIPKLMKGLGKGVHSFKQGMEEAKREINKPVEKADEEPVAAKDKD